MKKIILSVLSLVAVSSSAFAGTQPLANFDELRDACKNPAKYQNQIAPSNIQITCSEQLTFWSPAANGALALDTKHYITSALASDKYTVEPTTVEVQSSAQTVACGRLKEVNQTVSVPKTLSCDEVLAYQGDAASYCLAFVNDVKTNNPSAVQYADTGRTVDTCANVTISTAPAPAKGQSAPAQSAPAQSAPAQQSKSSGLFGWFN